MQGDTVTDQARTISPHSGTSGPGAESAAVSERDDAWTGWGRSGEELPRNMGAGLDAALAHQSRVALWAEALLFVAVLAVLDFITGVEINLSILYLVPVIFATWFISRRAGAFIATLSVAVWATLDSIGGVPYGLAIVIWNALVRLGLFMIVLWLVHVMKESRVREAALARTDSLTGVANGRSFSDRARFELASMRRSRTPLTMAYIDLDRFKHINDTLGHTEGDRLLRAVAAAIQSRLRATDLVARLGGDEFGVLFPDTDREAAPAALTALQEAVSETVDGSWDVGCTIGAVTFEMAPESVDFMVRSADDLMYRGKRAGRGRIEHSVWPGLFVGRADPGTSTTC
jgi:diguanylate cyclase (GGDEF)-like protein